MNGHPLVIEDIFLVDMDQVLARLHAKIVKRFNTTVGEIGGVTSISLDSFTNNSPAKGLSHIPGAKDLVETWLGESGFYRDLEIVDGAVDGMQTLIAKGFRPVILSSFGNAPGCVADKCAWLDEHFPFLPKKDRIFSACKALPNGAFFLDDGLGYLEEWMETQVLITDGEAPAAALTFKLPYTDVERAEGSGIIVLDGWADLTERLNRPDSDECGCGIDHKFDVEISHGAKKTEYKN